MEELIVRGAKGNSRNPRGESYLTYAVNMGHLDLVKALVLAGANIHETDFQGSGVLHFAYRHKNLIDSSQRDTANAAPAGKWRTKQLGMAEHLISAGADAGLQNFQWLYTNNGSN